MGKTRHSTFVIGQHHRIGHADKEWLHGIGFSVSIDGHNRCGWRTIDKAGEEGKVAVFAAGQGIECVPVAGGNVGLGRLVGVVLDWLAKRQ